MKPWRRCHDRKRSHDIVWMINFHRGNANCRWMKSHPKYNLKGPSWYVPSDSIMRRSRLVKPIEPFNKTTVAAPEPSDFSEGLFCWRLKEAEELCQVCAQILVVSMRCQNLQVFLKTLQWPAFFVVLGFVVFGFCRQMRGFQKVPSRPDGVQIRIAVTVVVDGRDAWKPSKHIYDYLILSIYIYIYDIDENLTRMREIRNVN